MNKIANLKKLIEQTNGEEIDLSKSEYKHIFEPKINQIKEKKKYNCKSCNKLIISVEDLKFHILYELCKMCELNKEV